MSQNKIFLPGQRAALVLAALLMAAPAAASGDTSSPTGYALQWGAPALLVRDLERSAAWYKGFLGFEPIAERIDGEARSLILARNQELLHLRAMTVDVTGSIGHGVGVSAGRRLTILVRDVDALVSDLQDRGIELSSVPQDDDDGRYRSATVLDPDGNPVTLSEPLPPGS